MPTSKEQCDSVRRGWITVLIYGILCYCPHYTASLGSAGAYVLLAYSVYFQPQHINKENMSHEQLLLGVWKRLHPAFEAVEHETLSGGGRGMQGR